MLRAEAAAGAAAGDRRARSRALGTPRGGAVHAHVAALLAGRAALVGSLRQSLELALAERVSAALSELVRRADRNFSLQWLARARARGAARPAAGDADAAAALGAGEALFAALLESDAVLAARRRRRAPCARGRAARARRGRGGGRRRGGRGVSRPRRAASRTTGAGTAS